VCAQEKGGKSNVEQSSIEFVLYCLHPWLNRIEQEFGRKLFSDMGRSAGKYFAKFDTRKLMYPDAAARSTFYSQGKQWGFLNTNMILELEDMNPVENEKVGETFWQPINMQDAGDPQKLGAKDQSDLDTAAKKELVEHQADTQVDAAKQTAGVNMKVAEQAHGHALAAAAVNNKHEQTMAKLGHPLQAAAPAQAAGSAATPDKQLEPAAKRFTKPVPVREAMREAYEEGFVFASQVNIDGEQSYRYLHPDSRVLVITYAPAKES